MLIDNSFIENCLQQIVNSQHTDPIKKYVRRKHDSAAWNISCPYCGDSASNPRNYRGNLNSLLFYKCFNCDKKSHFTSMCKDFNITIPIDIKIQLYEYLDKQATFKTYKQDFSSTDINKLLSLTELQNAINKHECKLALINLQPRQLNSIQDIYLNLRGIKNDISENIWQADFYISEDRTEPVIVSLNRKNDAIIGMQVRNLKEGKFRMFHIYTFQELYETLHEENDIPEGQMAMYNKLSYYYNILNVNFNNKITLFEGYIDSIFYPNSVGLVGTNTDTDFFEDNDLDIQYFYDNDQAGFDKSNDKLDSGFSVFLWNKLFKSIVDNKKSDDPYALEYRIKKVKDLNKLAILTTDPFKKLNLSAFFSVDKYDKIFLPPKKKIYKQYTKKIYNK